MAERGATAKLEAGDLDLLDPGPPLSSPASTSGSPPAAPSLSGRPLSRPADGFPLRRGGRLGEGRRRLPPARHRDPR
jgi:hypothetical protein